MATQDEKIKWVEGSPFMVDGFRFTNPRCKHYLLTHFHSGQVELLLSLLLMLCNASFVLVVYVRQVHCTLIEARLARSSYVARWLYFLARSERCALEARDSCCYLCVFV